MKPSNIFSYYCSPVVVYVVNCSAGHHSAIVDNIPRCVECERGTYNGMVGQGQCTQCRPNTSTIETGLTDDIRCQGMYKYTMAIIIVLIDNIFIM